MTHEGSMGTDRNPPSGTDKKTKEGQWHGGKGSVTRQHKQNMMKAGSEFLERTKKIRATLTADLEYNNELLSYGSKLDSKLRQVIDNTDFLCCEVVTGT